MRSPLLLVARMQASLTAEFAYFAVQVQTLVSEAALAHDEVRTEDIVALDWQRLRWRLFVPSVRILAFWKQRCRIRLIAGVRKRGRYKLWCFDPLRHAGL